MSYLIFSNILMVTNKRTLICFILIFCYNKRIKSIKSINNNNKSSNTVLINSS